jgi:hypothetical protein
MKSDMAATTSLIVPDQLTGNLPTSLNPLQMFLEPHLNGLIFAWWMIWCLTAIVLVGIVVRDYMRDRRNR